MYINIYIFSICKMEDYIYWQTEDRKTVKRINQFYSTMIPKKEQRHGFF